VTGGIGSRGLVSHLDLASAWRLQNRGNSLGGTRYRQWEIALSHIWNEGKAKWGVWGQNEVSAVRGVHPAEQGCLGVE
jgi:hypothetical protein